MRIEYVLTDGVAYADVCRYAALLPIERQEKIDRLRFDRDKLLSLIAGLLIQKTIGDVPLTINEHGKPYAVGSGQYFSVSHSGDCVVIAVDDKEIGADVEKLPDKEYLKIAERFYAPGERQYVWDAEDRDRAFARIWTRKEAYLKQLGTGIASDLRAFDTTSKELSRRLISYDIEGYAISVCTEDKIDPKTDYISKLELNELWRLK